LDIRIGVSRTAKELEIELPDDADADKITAEIEGAIGAGSMVWVTDRRGRRVGVPAREVAWVELGAPDSDRRIGFGS
jgi:Protein of unknown function (DUF3107)